MPRVRAARRGLSRGSCLSSSSDLPSTVPSPPFARAPVWASCDSFCSSTHAATTSERGRPPRAKRADFGRSRFPSARWWAARASPLALRCVCEPASGASARSSPGAAARVRACAVRGRGSLLLADTSAPSTAPLLVRLPAESAPAASRAARSTSQRRSAAMSSEDSVLPRAMDSHRRRTAASPRSSCPSTPASAAPSAASPGARPPESPALGVAAGVGSRLGATPSLALSSM